MRNPGYKNSAGLKSNSVPAFFPENTRINLSVFRFYLFISLVLSFSACKTIETQAPEEEYNTYTLQPELSYLVLPVDISIPGLQKTINTNISGLLYEDNDLNDGDDLMVKVWKKSEISITASGNEISYQVPLDVWLKTGKNLGLVSYYGDTKMSINLKFKTRVNVDKNWNVQTITTPVGYTWIEKPSWKVAGFDIPITPIADELVKGQMKDYAKIIDDQARPYMELRPMVEAAWKSLQNPLLMSDDPFVWLTMNPVEISMTPVIGNNEKISTTIGLTAYTQTKIGAKPDAIPGPALPPLKIGTARGGYFSISIISGISYEYASTLAESNMKGQEFTFGNKGKKKIKVDSVKVYGNGDKMVIGLGISGSLNGMIYVSGIPYYDGVNHALKVKDLDYDLDTKHKLLNTADWLAHGVFLKKLAPYLVYDLKDQIEENKKLINESLKNNQISPGIYIKGELLELKPSKVVLDPEGLNAVINATGKLSVGIDGF